MEEIYEWMNEAEKKADSIMVNEKDIDSVKINYGRQKVRTALH